MNTFLSNPNVFKDAVSQLQKDGLKNPFCVKQITSIDDVKQCMVDNLGILFLKNKFFLYHLDSSGYCFYVDDKEMEQNLKELGKVKVVRKKDFPLYLFFLLFMIINQEKPSRKLFEQNKSKFQNKLFYYLEIPVDPVTLKEWNIEPDMTAISSKQVVSMAKIEK